MNDHVCDINQWLSVNILENNSDKTEVMFLGIQQQRDKLYHYLNETVTLASPDIAHVKESNILIFI